MQCVYCGNDADLVTGEVMYPHMPFLADRHFYRCVPCDAYVGCHPGSLRALGTLANAELREARKAAHAAFDPLWKGGGEYSRGAAYRWLAGELGLLKDECHIGIFDLATCRRTVALAHGHALHPRNGQRVNLGTDTPSVRP